MRQVWLEAAAIALLIMFAGMLFLSYRLERRERLEERLRAIRRAPGTAPLPPPRRARRLLDIVSSLGATIVNGKLLSERTVNELRQTLVNAGMRAESALSLFVGGKLLLLFAMPAIAYLTAHALAVQPLFVGVITMVAAIIGLLMPDIIIRQVRGAYVARVDRGLADALDMMVICAEAGLTMSAAISRVAFELRHAHPATADELALTGNELVFVADSRQALLNMGGRTGLPGLKRIGSTTIQSMQYGTPLAQALRTLALELRTETLTRFEKKAAQLPVLLTIPMILFILPTLFVLVGGPAVLSVLEALKK